MMIEKRVEWTIKWGRALAVAAARFHAKDTFEVRCANRSCRVRERVGVSDRGISWRQGTKPPRIVGCSPRCDRRVAVSNVLIRTLEVG